MYHFHVSRSRISDVTFRFSPKIHWRAQLYVIRTIPRETHDRWSWIHELLNCEVVTNKMNKQIGFLIINQIDLYVILDRWTVELWSRDKQDEQQIEFLNDNRLNQNVIKIVLWNDVLLRWSWIVEMSKMWSCGEQDEKKLDCLHHKIGG